MQIYRFYFPKDRIGQNSVIIDLMANSYQLKENGHNYILYGITNHRKIAEQFMEERNMEYMVVTKDEMDKSEYQEFANEFRHLVLSETSLAARSVNKNGKIVSVEHTFILNDYERLAASYNGEEGMYLPIYTQEFWMNSIPLYLIKNKELIDMLRYMEYDLWYKIMTADTVVLNEDGEVVKTGDDDYNAPSALTDELSLFITLFHETLV